MICPECGRFMLLREGRNGKFWGCTGFPRCRVTHGCHADGTPLGLPGDAATRAARVRAHDAFDKLWRRGEQGYGWWSRTKAYRWLQKRMGLPAMDTHIGLFTIEQCVRACELVEQVLRSWEGTRRKEKGR